MSVIKKSIAITALILVLILALAAGVLFTKRWMVFKMGSRLNQVAETYGWQATVNPGDFLSHPGCIQSVQMSRHSSKIEMEDICISRGLFSLMQDNPDFAVDCEKVFILMNSQDLPEKNSEESSKTSKNSRISRLFNLDADVHVNHFHIQLDHQENHLDADSVDLTASLHQGKARADLSFSPHLVTGELPVKLGELPQMAASVQADFKDRAASFTLKNEPKLQVRYDYQGNPFEIGLERIQMDYRDHQMGLILGNLDISSPEYGGISSGQIESIEATYVPGDEKRFQNLKIVRPTLHIDLPKLLEIPGLRQHPVFSALIDFWTQKAGSILGEAPQNSVRRADVKKKLPPVQSNPISRETLDKIRESFESAQKKLVALPAVDIQEGNIDIVTSDGHLSFDAISFNTAALLQDTQKFQLDFNVREASASFLIQYADTSPFPSISFNVQKLAAADFLHIINMPVPEQNAGQVSLKLAISLDENAFGLEGNVAFEDFAFFHEKVSPNLIHDIHASAQVKALYTFKTDTLQIEPLVFTSGPMTATGFIRVRSVRSDPVIEFEIGAEDLRCEDIPKAIPPGFLSTITDLRIIGSSMSPRISGTIPWKHPLTSKLSETGFDNSCFPESVAPHLPENLNDEEYTFTTQYTYFVDEITVGPGTASYVRLQDIPPYVRAAMFLTEDKRFFDHGPLRIAFIERALRLNLNKRSYVYGGSTIAQQLTKNLFLNRNKNLARKLEEALIAWRLERVVPRSRIFELYVNIIEFGPDVYGIRNASRFYFGKEPTELTPLEGAYLASLKVSPSKGGRFYKSGFPSGGGWWRKRFRYILRVLAENGYIAPIDILEAHDWVPRFVYPPPNVYSDPRNIWLNRYSSYLRAERHKNDNPDEEEIRD